MGSILWKKGSAAINLSTSDAFSEATWISWAIIFL